MRIVDAYEIEKTVAELCVEANTRLPESLCRALKKSLDAETFPPARNVLNTLIENAEIAEHDNIPVCQDTGAACVFLDVGEEVFINGGVYNAVDRGVAAGYSGLRKSIVSDPLRRVNTDDNTPAFTYVEYVPGDKIKVTVAPKGFGSENMSVIAMLKPSDGKDGVIDFVVETVRSAGGSPCPPTVVGVGIGGTFDRAAYLAKRALLRDLGESNADPYYASIETEILERVNNLGIGPQGFGGLTTALGVSIISAPTHIAGLPVAVNLSCHVTRHASAEI